MSFYKPGIPANTVFPSEEAQELYPLKDYPCELCANSTYGLPFLVDMDVEFYWHHVHPKSGARDGCARFGSGPFCGDKPRKGTAQPTNYKGHYQHRDADHPRKKDQ